MLFLFIGVATVLPDKIPTFSQLSGVDSPRNGSLAVRLPNFAVFVSLAPYTIRSKQTAVALEQTHSQGSTAPHAPSSHPTCTRWGIACHQRPWSRRSILHLTRMQGESGSSRPLSIHIKCHSTWSVSIRTLSEQPCETEVSRSSTGHSKSTLTPAMPKLSPASLTSPFKAARWSRSFIPLPARTGEESPGV